MLWKKGNFSDNIVYNALSDHQIISQIVLHNQNGFMQIVFTNKEEPLNLEAFLDQLGCKYSHSMGVLNIVYEENYTVKPYMKKLLCELSKIDPNCEEIYADICSQLREKNFIAIDLEELIMMPVSRAISMVLDAQNNNRRLIWELLECYEKESLSNLSVSAQQLYDLAIGISKNDPDYHQAQDKCVHYLLQMIPPEDPEEKYKFSQCLFRHALKGTHQILRNRFFSDLCGEKFSPIYQPEVKKNAATIIAAAMHIKILNEKIQQLNQDRQTDCAKRRFSS
jgi:hypothetical protein